MFKRYIHNASIAFEAVLANKFRSLLTALGIIFGVAAVIAMMSIGNGTKQEILEQLKSVGANKIIVKTISSSELEMESEEADDEEQGAEKDIKPVGLSLADMQSILATVPTVKQISPEVSYDVNIIGGEKKQKGHLIGITPAFFNTTNTHLIAGSNFSATHIKEASPVCLISSKLSSRIFPKSSPIGQMIKCDKLWFKVIGIVATPTVSANNSDLGIEIFDNCVYTPIRNVLNRYSDRSIISSKDIATKGRRNRNEVVAEPNFHQIDKMVIEIQETEMLRNTANLIGRMLKRRHQDQTVVEVVVPELLLKQHERNKEVFSLVLVAIASISLIVGGIGIMNIMLASVMERTKEIGVRLALGARKTDVIFQFLSESIFISVTGGLIGILLGLGLTKILANLSVILPNANDIPAILSPISIVISFLVSASVGIIFGYMPAKKAASKDPVLSLRYE